VSEDYDSLHPWPSASWQDFEVYDRDMNRMRQVFSARSLSELFKAATPPFRLKNLPPIDAPKRRLADSAL